MSSGPYEAERTGPLRPSPRGAFPTGRSLPRCSQRRCQSSEGEGSPGGAPSRTNGPSTGQLLKGREGRSPQRSCFNKRFFPEKGKAGERGRGTYLKLPCCSLSRSVCRGLWPLPQTGGLGLGSSWRALPSRSLSHSAPRWAVG